MSIETNKTAGDDVDSRCLKCKAVTNHTIIAKTGATIAKVQCNSCNARHNYRAPKDDKKKSASTRRRRDGKVTETGPKSTAAKKSKSTSKKVSRGAVNFDALIDGKDISVATPYALDATLAAGDLLNHKIFGLGVVMATILPNKAEVVFREQGTKILVCTLS